MSTSLGQFVLGFAISFSPAPLVGFGAWTLVNAQEAAPEVQPSQGYGAPVQREWGEHQTPHAEHQLQLDEDYAPQQSSGQHSRRMEVEEDCARRKRKPAPAPVKPKKPDPDAPIL